jgi:hypothetical protein
MYDFVQLLAPHLNRRVVERAAVAESQAAVDALFLDVDLPRSAVEPQAAPTSPEQLASLAGTR